jgi:GT2 family glycosyltransferase
VDTSTQPLRPPASIVIPTRARPHYLEVALASIAPQAADLGAELLVVDDGGSAPDRRSLVERFGARYIPHHAPLGLNHARNTGVEHSTGELVVFVDDDVEVAPGWLKALLRASRSHPEIAVFTGPIHPRLEGRPPRSCGREAPPLTSLDLGSRDSDTARFAWGTNMAIRRDALERVGPFDTSLREGGDEQEWQERLRSTGDGRTLYVAAAGLYHRRAGADVRLRALMRTAFTRGAAARRFDRLRGQAPSWPRELATLARCLGHVVVRRCPAGLTMAAHSAGRLREATRELARRGAGMRVPPGAGDSSLTVPRDDFVSGASGAVGGLDGLRRQVADKIDDGLDLATARRRRLRRAARSFPERRRVLVLSVEYPERAALAAAARAEIERSRHRLDVRVGPPGGRSKFENLNLLLAESSVSDYDWLIALDDDVELPRGFLDSLLFLAERFSLDLAQPAYRRDSHAAWPVTRRHRRSAVRETGFVEIGPVTVFARSTFGVLLPFPEVGMGWGLDAHWAALAREHRWRCGIVDAVPVRHRAAPVARSYSREAALADARGFLAEHPYLPATETQRTLVTHRHW